LKLLRIGIAAALLATGGLVHSSAGTALADDVRLSVVLDEFTPLIALPGRKLTLRGRLVNLNAEEIRGLQLSLRVSTQPLANRASATSVAEGTMPNSRPLDNARIEVDETLTSRGQTPFVVTIPLDAMNLPGNGTYALSLTARGTSRAEATALGEVTTFLPWFIRTEPGQRSYTPIKVVWLWPLADWPARTANGTLLDQRTPDELSPGGRLYELTNMGADHTRVVSWVADPSLLQTAAAMTGGYQVLRDGRVEIGDRGDAAANWLAQLREIDTTPMWVMPYADIDAAASRRADLSTDVVRSVTQSAGIAQRALNEPVQPGLYWAPFGRLDNPTANLLSSAGVTTVVLSAAALPDEQAITPTGRATLGTSFGALNAVLIDPTLATLLVAPQQTRNEIVLARQRFLAETALIATEVTEETEVRTIVIAPRNVRWNPNPSLINPLLRASVRAPWMTPSNLSALLAETPPIIPRDRAGYGERARAAELSQQYLTQVRRVSQRVELLASIVDNPAELTEPFAAAILRAQSSAWRSEPDVAGALVRSIRTEINQVINDVRVLSAGNITFSGDVGRVPITIANDLDQSVTVGLRLIGEPASRLVSQDTTDISIEAGRKASVDIDARVIGGEPLNVSVQLLTPEGEKYGVPTAIQVNSTAYARAASWVVIGAFIALAIFVIVGVTRRVYHARQSSA
jgi:hypothetical protein